MVGANRSAWRKTHSSAGFKPGNRGTVRPNGDVRADRNGARLPARLNFPRRFRARWQAKLHIESEI